MTFTLPVRFGTGTDPGNTFPPKVGADLDAIAAAIAPLGSIPYQFKTPGAAEQYEDGVTPLLANFMAGSTVVPVTDLLKCTVGVSRYEVLGPSGAVLGGQNSCLYVESKGHNDSSTGNIQTTGLTVKTQQHGTGDCLGLWGQATQNGGQVGGNGFTAYGGFFNVEATTAKSGALAIETNTINSTGVDSTIISEFGGTNNGLMVGIDLVAAGNNRCSQAVYIRTNNSLAGAGFDAGVLFEGGGTVTYDMFSRSSAINTLTDIGTHTNGIDLHAGTYSGAPILAPLKTPASSSAAGTQGAIMWDSGFIYVCVSTNTWKRAALSSF